MKDKRLQQIIRAFDDHDDIKTLPQLAFNLMSDLLPSKLTALVTARLSKLPLIETDIVTNQSIVDKLIECSLGDFLKLNLSNHPIWIKLADGTFPKSQRLTDVRNHALLPIWQEGFYLLIGEKHHVVFTLGKSNDEHVSLSLLRPDRDYLDSEITRLNKAVLHVRFAYHFLDTWSRLSDTQRQVLMMSAYGMWREEISTRLGLSVHTVDERLVAARKIANIGCSKKLSQWCALNVRRFDRDTIEKVSQLSMTELLLFHRKKS